MPLLKLQTNQAIENRDALLRELSASTAQMLGKPEGYVMVIVEGDIALSFAGATKAAAYLELKSIGLPGAKTRDFSRELCELVGGKLDIPRERIYIEFADAPRAMWGLNGSTF